MVILGILSAIALPSLLNQRAKSQESEAKTYIGTMNRAQQAYYLANLSFATHLNALALGIPTQTNAFIYQIAPGEVVTHQAQPRDLNLRGYAGVVSLLEGSRIGTVLCQADDPGMDPVGQGTVVAGALVCPSNYRPLN